MSKLISLVIFALGGAIVHPIICIHLTTNLSLFGFLSAFSGFVPDFFGLNWQDFLALGGGSLLTPSSDNMYSSNHKIGDNRFHQQYVNKTYIFNSLKSYPKE